MAGAARNTNDGATLGCEEKLRQAADKMRGRMDPSEYKRVVLGLIFLKCRSDAFEQESNYTTWRLARMNLAICGIDDQIAHGDTSHKVRHLDLKADYILANPPFNVSDWGGELLKNDKRWKYCVASSIQPTQDRRLSAAS